MYLISILIYEIYSPGLLYSINLMNWHISSYSFICVIRDSINASFLSSKQNLDFAKKSTKSPCADVCCYLLLRFSYNSHSMHYMYILVNILGIGSKGKLSITVLRSVSKN